MQQFLAASVTAALLFSSVDGASAAALRRRNLSATAGWAPTLTRAFLLKGATDLGAAPWSMSLHLALGLHGDLAGANALIHRITSPRDPLYGRTLTPRQFTAMFAPSSAAATSVATYLANLGMHHVTIAPNRLLVTADTPSQRRQRPSGRRSTS